MVEDMSGVRNRTTGSAVPSQATRKITNPIDQQVLGLNERILNEIFTIYTDKNNGESQIVVTFFISSP